RIRMAHSEIREKTPNFRGERNRRLTGSATRSVSHFWFVSAEGGTHRLKYAIIPDQPVEENRCDVHEDQREKGKGQVEMRMPQQRVEGGAQRQDRRQMYAAVQHHRVG